MVQNVAKKGVFDSLMLYNRTAATAKNLASSLSSERVSTSESIQDCVSFADIIFTCVGDDGAISEMVSTAIEGGKVDPQLFSELNCCWRVLLADSNRLKENSSSTAQLSTLILRISWRPKSKMPAQTSSLALYSEPLMLRKPVSSSSL